jgi:DNA-binding response OmpR family regulator
MGAWVVESADGKQAIASLNDRKIDIALLDVLMPEVHGLYVLHAIRSGATKSNFAMPVMMLTATRDEATVNYALGLSCDGFLLKPVKQVELEERLAKILTKRMALPYKPPYYRKIDIGPPDKPPEKPSVSLTGLCVADLEAGMVFISPVVGAGETIVPSGTLVTPELLVLLHDAQKQVLIEAMTIELPKRK